MAEYPSNTHDYTNYKRHKIQKPLNLKGGPQTSNFITRENE